MVVLIVYEELAYLCHFFNAFQPVPTKVSEGILQTPSRVNVYTK